MPDQTIVTKVLQLIDGYEIVLFLLSNMIIACISTTITLWLTNRKENRERKARFANRLVFVAHELQINFQGLGNSQNPFQTKALEKLVYEEPLIHKHPKLFEKAEKCLLTASLLSRHFSTSQIKARRWTYFDERSG